MNKQDWTYKKLGEVCKVLNGLWVGKKKPFVNIAVIRNTNFSKDCKLKLDDVAYIDVEERQFATRKLQVGDIIIEKSGGSDKQPVGRPVLFNIPDGDYSFSNFTSTLRLTDKSIFPPFLHYCLYGYYRNGETKKMQSKTTGLRNLDMKAYLRLAIPYFEIAEQERIVAELDLLQGIIEKKKEQLKAYDQLAQSIFYTMFGDPIDNPKGWETKKLSENVHEMFLGPFGSALKVDSYVPKEESYCMVYEQKHAIQATINLDNHYINKEKFESLQRFEVKPHDFIMSCRGTIGKLYQLPNNAPKGIIHPSLMKIRIKEEFYNSAFFQFLLVKIIANESTNGNCVQMAITAKELGKKELPVPPLSLQEEFAEKVEAIERQKALVQQSIEETQTMFDYTMDKYFG